MLHPDNQSFFEKLKKTQEAYLVQKAYNQTQEEILTSERQQSLLFREKLIRATKAFLALDKVHKSSVQELHRKNEQLAWSNGKLEEENAQLKTSVNELQEQCEHLRALQAEHNQDVERIWKLEEDLEVARTEKDLERDIHREEIASLKKKHIKEMLKYKISFESARLKFQDGKRNRLKKGSRGAFRWPTLGVEKIGPTQVQEEDTEEDQVLHPALELTNRNSITERIESAEMKSQEEVEPAKKKRRKLFYQDQEAVFDLVNP